MEIDLRSDAITTPTAEMWQAMEAANLGWASAGEDSSVLQLEAAAARLAGKESAIFVLTGSMANLSALLSHAERGDQVVLEASSHILWCEEWGLSYVAGLVPRAIDGHRGMMEPDDVVNAIQESKYRHRPRTALLWLENTDNVYGAALSPASISAMANAAHGLGVHVHLDGARVFNACVAHEVALSEMLNDVDSAMISLNKGLSAPGGALLVGDADFIRRSRLNLRRVGGGSHHQAGIYAAAALVALDSMMDQLGEDNRRARRLATLFAAIPRLHVDPSSVETNVVVLEIAIELSTAQDFVAELAKLGVRAYVFGAQSVRFVTHRHVDDSGIEQAAECVARVVQGWGH